MEQKSFKNFLLRNYNVYIISDHLFGIVVSTSDYHPRGPGFDSEIFLKV